MKASYNLAKLPEPLEQYDYAALKKKGPWYVIVVHHHRGDLLPQSIGRVKAEDRSAHTTLAEINNLITARKKMMGLYP